MSKLWKDASSFGGYWLKSLKEFRGHDGESLVQANVFYKNKKIGFFSEDGWGGPCQLQGFHCNHEKSLREYAEEFTGSDFEPEHEFLCEIAGNIETRQYYMKQCRTKTLVKSEEHKEGEFIAIDVKWKGNEARIRMHLVNEGKKNFIIINEEFK